MEQKMMFIYRQGCFLKSFKDHVFDETPYSSEKTPQKASKLASFFLDQSSLYWKKIVNLKFKLMPLVALAISSLQNIED